MKTKIVIRSSFDSPPEEAVNECLQTLSDVWKVAHANTTSQFYTQVGEQNTVRPHFVTTLILEERELTNITEDRGLLTTPINMDRLTVRAQNVLGLRKISTLGDLVKYSWIELVQTRNCGKKSINEFRAYLSGFGLALKDEKPPKVLGPAIHTLRISSLARNSILRKVQTIPDLLQLSRSEVFKASAWGSIVQTIVALVEAGYSENDGPFLSKQEFALLMRKNAAYRFVVKLDARGQLTSKFKTWFNEAIHGYQYNTEGLSTPRFTVQPFKIKA